MPMMWTGPSPYSTIPSATQTSGPPRMLRHVNVGWARDLVVHAHDVSAADELLAGLGPAVSGIVGEQ